MPALSPAIEATRYVLYTTLKTALDRLLGDPHHKLWWWLLDFINAHAVHSRAPVVRVQVGPVPLF